MVSAGHKGGLLTLVERKTQGKYPPAEPGALELGPLKAAWRTDGTW